MTDTRKDFESWAKERHFVLSLELIKTNFRHQQSETNYAYLAWQAAKAQDADLIRELVDILSPIEDFDWVGKWRIKQAIAKAQKHMEGK